MNPSHERCHPAMLARLAASVVCWWRHRIIFLPKHAVGWISWGAWIFHPTFPGNKYLIKTKDVFSLLDKWCLSSLLTLGAGYMTSTWPPSQQGANKIFFGSTFYSSCAWTEATAQQEVFISSHHVTKRGFRAFIDNTPTSFTILRLSRKTWKHQQFIENYFPAFEILLFFKWESSYS